MPALRACFGLALLAMVFALAFTIDATAQGTSTSPDDEKPITIYADRVIFWTEGANNALHAKGNVSIERGTTRIKMRDAILWMTKSASGEETRAILYGEASVTLEENSKPKRTLERISLQWRTSGELRVIAPDKKSGQPAAIDPIYLRSKAVLSSPPPLDTPTGESPPVATAPPTVSSPSVAPPITASPTKTEAAKPPETGIASQLIKQREQEINQGQPSPTPDVSSALNRTSTLGISSRTSSPYQYRILPSNHNEYSAVFWGGITLYAGDENSIIDISADRVVIWAKGITGAPGQGVPNFSNFRKEQVEVYLEGHVEIRYRRLNGPSANVDQLVLADRGYYDLGRNSALLSKCELIYNLPGVRVPIHVQAAEVRQVDLNNFQASDAAFFASRLPSDPDIKVMAGTFNVQLRDMPHRGFLGATAYDPVLSTGTKEAGIFGSADDVKIKFLDCPVGSFRHLEGDLRDPLGPIEGVRFVTGNIFGVGMELQLDALEIFGIDKAANTRWTLSPLFFSKRGPGLITEFQSSGVGLFGIPGRYDTFVRGQLQYDYDDIDTLGRLRKPEVPQEIRGLLTLRHRQELDEHWTFQTQVGYQSDRNFYESWWKRQYDEDLNQETFGLLKYTNDQFSFGALVKPNIRPWVNEGAALPRGDLWLVGQDLFNTLTYYGHASAGLYRFNASSDLTDAYFNTPFPDEFDRYHLLPPSSDMPHRDSFWLSRFNIMNELALPINLGIMNVTPYALANLAYYSDDMSGNDAGQAWYGLGVRTAMPFTKLYSNVQSDFFNVRGINHKVSLEADFRTTKSNTDFRRLPLLDRLDDDTTDQARRDLRIYRLQNNLNLNLATSPIYDPQLYALRRGYLGSPDNLDDMEYLRFGVRNRWQTKRGVEEAERTVDWMTFDIFASYFPNEGRDNYGNPFGLIDYNFSWQIGERTSIVANGYIDPFSGGSRSLSAGVLVERTERVRFYFGYYNLEPIGTNAIVWSTSYVLNPKYAVTWSSSYDFGGSQNLGQSFMVTRTGSDLQVSVGLGYDPLRSNFSAMFEVYPTLLGPTRHMRAVTPGAIQVDPSTVPY